MRPSVDFLGSEQVPRAPSQHILPQPRVFGLKELLPRKRRPLSGSPPLKNQVAEFPAAKKEKPVTFYRYGLYAKWR